jgi:hypothetical protein
MSNFGLYEVRGMTFWLMLVDAWAIEHITLWFQESFLLNSPPPGVYISFFLSGIEFSDKHTIKVSKKCHGNHLTEF